MPSQLEQEHEVQPGISTLVSGIIHDAQDLVRQQLTLFQVEIKNDTRRTIAAMIPIIVGMLVGLLALVVLALMAAHLLYWLWPELHLWGAHGIVGGVLAVAAGVLIWWGAAQFKKFSPLPDQTVEGLKENIQWQTKR
jgi:uncharacterized membrane protein YqjE